MRVSVCIPTVRTTTLEHAVRSIQRQSFGDWELIVVGQGNADLLSSATERAAAGDNRIRYLHLDRRGASAARNAGAAVASGEIVAFMDDDCEADPDWLRRLDECFEPDVGFVCGSVIAPAKERRLFAVIPVIDPADVIYDPAKDGDEPPTGFGLLGANMAVRRSDIARVGTFDECMGPGSYFQGGEEHDYAFRLGRSGVRMRATPTSIVHHTYGYRYGLKAVYSHKRERIRGDGALAAKGTLAEAPDGGLSVNDCVKTLARAQVRAITLRRLPFGLFRLFHYAKSYRECLRNFVLSSDDPDDPVKAVLVPRPDDGPRSVTGPFVTVAL